MTNAEKIRLIEKYQSCPHVHPLTCGKGTGGHQNLVPVERDGAVILICKDCDYIQTDIPECVIDLEFIEGQDALWKALFGEEK